MSDVQKNGPGLKSHEIFQIPEQDSRIKTSAVMSEHRPAETGRLQFGNVELPNRLLLAPMAGVTDLPFRLICREFGCGMTCTEMVSAKAILYNNRNTWELMETGENEHPVAVQLFGSDPEIVSSMAQRIEDGPFDIIDLNMGCPVPKVVNNGEGSALMKDPKLVERLLGMLVSRVKKPVTVKFRKGFDDAHVNAVEIAKIAESCGVAGIAVHGRTREQYYSGQADWDIIRQVKKAVKIPVIGNGDIFTPQDAKRMLEETGCDGIMIARGARGNPWLFRRILQYLETGEVLPEPDAETVAQMILRHAKMQIELKGEVIGMKEMRKHIAWYTAGLRHSAAIRRESNLIETFDQLQSLLETKLLQPVLDKR